MFASGVGHDRQDVMVGRHAAAAPCRTYRRDWRHGVWRPPDRRGARPKVHSCRLLATGVYGSLVPTHFVAHWQHTEPDDPIRIHEEVADDRTELRKAEEFRDERLVRAYSITDASGK